MSKDDRKNPDPLRTVKLMWDPPPPPKRGPKARNTLPQIVAAATRLADELGPDALSMRLLAKELDCGTMSLYTYVSSKAELLELMVDQVHAEIREPPANLDWQGQVFVLAIQQWQLYHRHPWVLQGQFARLSLGPNCLDVAELVYGALEKMGLSPEDVYQCAGALNAYIRGAARNSLLELESSRETGVSSSEIMEARRQFWDRYFNLDRYPVHTRLWTLGGMSDSRDPFEYGLNRLLDGFQSLRSI